MYRSRKEVEKKEWKTDINKYVHCTCKTIVFTEKQCAEYNRYSTNEAHYKQGNKMRKQRWKSEEIVSLFSLSVNTIYSLSVYQRKRDFHGKVRNEQTSWNGSIEVERRKKE